VKRKKTLLNKYRIVILKTTAAFLQIPIMKTTSLSYLTITMLFLLLISCSSKKNNSFVISGKISNLNEDFAILSVVDDIQNNKTTIIDTLKINKKGKFNSVYFLEPNIYNLTFDNKKTITLAIDEGQQINIKGESIDDLKITGSIDTDLLNAYEDFRKESLTRLVKSVRNKIKNLQLNNALEKEITELRNLEIENYQKHLNELILFIKEKMGTSIAVYPTSIRWNGDENLAFLKELVTNFQEKHPSTTISKKLKERIQLLEKTSIGGFITNIEMPSASNEKIKLDPIHKKYTLIDFWASWCPPCRSEGKLLNKLYASYRAQGFEIYGISLDSNREKWLNALEKDQRGWINVSTLEGFKTPESIEYGITALPTNFLIDNTGKIIAVNIFGEQLEEKINSLFLKESL